jgi:excisionase family DNA binding protein
MGEKDCPDGVVHAAGIRAAQTQAEGGDEMKTAEQTMKRYTNVEAEAQRIGVCLRSFRQLVRRGLVPSYKVGRRILLVAEEVDRALEEQFRRGKPQTV